MSEREPRRPDMPNESENGVVTTGVDPDGYVPGIEMPLAEQVDFEWSIYEDDHLVNATVWMNAGHWELPVWSYMDQKSEDEYGWQWFGTAPDFENGNREELRPVVLELIPDSVQYDYESVKEVRSDAFDSLEWYEEMLIEAFVRDYTGPRNPDGMTSGLMSVLFDKGVEHQETGNPQEGEFNPHGYDSESSGDTGGMPALDNVRGDGRE